MLFSYTRFAETDVISRCKYSSRTEIQFISYSSLVVIMFDISLYFLNLMSHFIELTFL